MLGQHLTHANFSVDDLATAKNFYIDTLGFTAEQQVEDAVLLKSSAGTRVFVYEKPDHQAWDSTVLGIEVDDVKAAVGELRASGISIEKLDGTDADGIMTIPDMGEAAWFRDPAGNWICVSRLG
jgi:catechol 2,3-dioxygenase-like lactoylglutathione lyase family enzyme